MREKIAVQAGEKSKTTSCASIKHPLLYIFIFQSLFSFLGPLLFTFMLCKQYGKDFVPLCMLTYSDFSAWCIEVRV